MIADSYLSILYKQVVLLYLYCTCEHRTKPGIIQYSGQKKKGRLKRVSSFKSTPFDVFGTLVHAATWLPV